MGIHSPSKLISTNKQIRKSTSFYTNNTFLGMKGLTASIRFHKMSVETKFTALVSQQQITKRKVLKRWNLIIVIQLIIANKFESQNMI